MKDYDCIVVGCGLSGAVVARYIAETLKKSVLVLERRNHIAGNMYDYIDKAGILVHKYGPHTFHTVKRELFDFMCQYEEWEEYHLNCMAQIDGKFTPTPFNFKTIDDFFPKDKAEKVKLEIKKEYPNESKATVVELLNHHNDLIREFAQFLFDKDYSLYTAKQWGISPSEIDPSVLKRVPIKFNYEVGYFDDKYQVMPKHSYVHFFNNLLDHPNITVELEVEAKDRLKIDIERKEIYYMGKLYKKPIVFTGAIDELFDHKFGKLPYRSLRFEWKTDNIDSFQPAPVVAYPQAEGYTRITEYKKLPIQDIGGVTTYAIEYSLTHNTDNDEMEPYYPVPTDKTEELYNLYKQEAKKISNLYLCGRLADYKYYNMDQALERALIICKCIKF